MMDYRKFSTPLSTCRCIENRKVMGLPICQVALTFLMPKVGIWIID